MAWSGGAAEGFLDLLGDGELVERQARGHGALLQALPDRYATVLHDLLDRLESSALFSEESCSFSQSGLLDNLQLWIDKARGQLEKA